MEPAKSVGDFVRDPVGRYVAGRTWIAFCSPDQISGFQLWGTSAAHDVEELLATVVTEGSQLAQPRPRLVDIRRLGAIEPAVFDVFAAHFARYRDALAHLVTRAAVMHTPGIGAALAAGFSSVTPMPYEVELFTDPALAAEWLGTTTTLIDELDDLHAEASETLPLLRDLRACLRANLRDATVAFVAAQLAMSTRTLQRELARVSSTFQDELHRVRIERAQELLVETSYPLARIAQQIGFTSAHHFGLVFKQATGETPRRWRVMQQTKTP
jgi:AraC-like DNA-binding protein